ncbi:MAG: type II secretion system F family protein [Magnetococcales bacterium]|nr:type II secretion system F family protein [Magnetococcales bacterium]
MPEYIYSGRDKSSKVVKGKVRGQSEGAVADELINRGIVPLHITLIKSKSDEPSGLNIELTKKTPTPEDLVQFARQMHALVKSGVPIIKSIQGIAEITHNAMLAKALSTITERLQGGQNLANAIQEHSEIFPNLFTNMIRIGEETGRLDEAFKQLYEYIEVEMETTRKINTALRYPKIVLTGIFVALFVLNYFVIPTFAQMFANLNTELPLPTRILLSMSNFTKSYWYIILLSVAGSILGFKYYLRTKEGRLWWDRKLMEFPLIGPIVTQATLARFARTFAMGSRSGVPILDTLHSVSRAMDNAYVSLKMEEIRNGIERGESLAQAANNSELFTPLVLQMISVGEETGSLETMMQDVAEFYEREVSYSVKAMADGIEPIILTFIGIMVLVLALGIFLPLAGMGKAMMHKR